MCKNTRIKPAFRLRRLFIDTNNWSIHNIIDRKKGHFTDYHVYLSYDKRGKPNETNKNCNMR